MSLYTELKYTLNCALQNDNINTISRIILFGSSTYGEFVSGFSDLDIFLCFHSDATINFIEDMFKIKHICSDITNIKGIDITIAFENELNINSVSLNPLLYELISNGKSLVGEMIPRIFSQDDIINDCKYLSRAGISELRALVCRMYAPKPVMLLKSCDDVLFRSTKALLSYVTGSLCSSRTQSINILQQRFPDIDISVYSELMNLRNSTYNGEVPIEKCERIVINSTLTFELLYKEVFSISRV